MIACNPYPCYAEIQIAVRLCYDYFHYDPTNHLHTAMKHDLLTVSQAAQLQGVTSSAIYKAIAQNRLPHHFVLGRLGLREADLRIWDAKRETRGRAKGTTLTPEHRARIATAQKERWRQRLEATGKGAIGAMETSSIETSAGSARQP